MELIEVAMLRTLPDKDARGDVVNEWQAGQTYAFDPGSAAALIARGDARATGTRREAPPTAFPGRAVVSLTSPGGAIFGTVSWLRRAWVTVGDVYIPQRLHVDMRQ
jgi:hypothetical protein